MRAIRYPPLCFHGHARITIDLRFDAMRRASSRVKSLAAEWLTGDRALWQEQPAAWRRLVGRGGRGAAAKLAGGYGGALKLTTAFPCFGCGANIGICRGRSCSIFGACPISRSSIATSTPQNALQRRGTDEPRRHLKLN